MLKPNQTHIFAENFKNAKLAFGYLFGFGSDFYRLAVFYG